MNKVLSLADYSAMSDREMREAYSDTMLELGAANKNIMVLDVDCSRSMASGAFKKAYPEQYMNIGIQEANAVGVAAGLSAEKQIPFLNAFGVFATRRVFDQVFLSCGYAKLNVKIIGWDAGIGAEANGGTHMPFEDMGIMRSIPEMIVVEPADPAALKQILVKCAELYGNVYIRSMRKQVPCVYHDDLTLEIGKANLLKQGEDLTIIACGLMVSEALKAADVLKSYGVNARVVDMFTIKPLDEEAVIKCAKETGAIVVAENHRSVNGLYSAVSDCASANCPCPIEAVGVDDIFGEVGKKDYLMERFGLTFREISDKALNVLKRKEK
ncbi:transketolase family protein [Ihubacter massiliensis]|uniref:Transketolase family protein n=1 Tax=Hominibacterium faecale TaxID=2839743 RepID=A0A9J6QRL1_9FIRM|nr:MULTISPECIES: transketolase C-terminal domain-containing protein [Eubacteriales Family XIII. Incertae Sedis]MCO7121569.1 transketolase family protein [Ihubacter massiliensis]MCU7378549.1 transketolase family protein [Hominibacterium faecale]